MPTVLRQAGWMVAGAALLAVVLLGAALLPLGAPSVAVAAVQVVAPDAATARDVMQYQGQLFNPNGGLPLANAAVNGSFRIYGQASGGTPLWIEDKVVNTNADGLFNTLLGSLNSLPLNVFDGRELFLAVAINGEEGGPRLPLTYAPYAFWARNADQLDGLGSGDFLQPVAHGIVDENGNRVRGIRFSSRVGNDNVYEITIDNVSYQLNDFVTVVTPVSQSGCPRPTLAASNSDGGKLLVEMLNRDGANVRCKFHFVVTRP